MPDYIFMLESRLTPGQLRVLNQVQQEAQDAGLNLYLVGGAVRDLMTGAPIRDLDFVVEGNPLRLVRAVTGEDARRVQVDEEQRRAELMLADGILLSLEMAHAEFYRQLGQPPEMRPTPILQDLQRRDFSLNAMGVSLTPGSRGLLLDPTNGLADIERRELRILHHQGFLQDPVRLLRLVRFSIRLGFRPEARTAELFEAALEAGAQDSLSAEVLRREAEAIAREANPVAVLKALAERELLAVLHPQLQKRRPDYDGLAKLQKYVLQAQAAGYSLDPFYLVLHYLFGRLKAGARHALLRRLRLSTAEQKQALSLEKEAAKLVKLLRSHRRAGPRETYHLLTPMPMELLIFSLATYSQQRKVQTKVYNYLFRYRPLRQKLPVRELHLLGIPAGPKFDQILEKFFEAQLDGKIRGRVQESAYLRKLAGIAPPPKQKPKKKEGAQLALGRRRKAEPAGTTTAVAKPVPAAVPAAAGKTAAALRKAAAAREKRKAKLRSLLERRPRRAGPERRRGR